MSNFFEVSATSEVGREFTPAPETMETRFGTLEFPGGYPTDETVKRVYDELDLQRATQLYLDMYPALSSHGLMKGWVRDLGMSDSTQINVTADRLDSSALVLTGNTEIDKLVDRGVLCNGARNAPLNKMATQFGNKLRSFYTIA